MTPSQPEKQSRPSKRHQRSRSFSMTAQPKFIDLTGDSENVTGSSRKHDRNDQETQVEGPSKRPKMKMDSEPPMSKDESLTPKAKRKKLRKEVNHRKGRRTSNHQQLKENVRDLDNELKDAKQKHHRREQQLQERIKSLETELDTSKRAHQAAEQKLDASKQKSMKSGFHLERGSENSLGALDGTRRDLTSAQQQLKDEEGLLQSTISKLKDAQSSHDLKSEEVRRQQLTIETNHVEIQHLKALVDDPVKGLQAMQESCKRKDADLKSKDNRIVALEKKLDEKTAQFANLEKALGESNAALNTATTNQANFCNELVKITEKLTSAEHDRDNAKAACEEAEKNAEALHLVNEAHGHRTHGARTREQKAKETLKSERSEKAKLQARCTELQANLKDQESEHNQAVASLQQKLMASRNQSQRYNYKEPDEKIRKDFASLDARIRQFVVSFVRPVFNATDQNLKTLWPNWSPRLRDFLASTFLCNLVLEAYVWECLVPRIFSPGSEIWTGELGQSLDKTLRLAGNEVEGLGFKSDLYVDFQYLRSSSSSLIHHLNCADFLPKYFASDVEAMTSTLAKLCGCEITPLMKADAMAIFQEAREFEIQLRMLKAVYGFITCKVVVSSEKIEKLKHGFDFMDENMVDRSPKRSGKSPGQNFSVDFITCPGIYKRGNNSGANYDTKTCLIKMGVVCNAGELLKLGLSNLSPPSSTQVQEATPSSKASTSRRTSKATPTAGSIKSEDDEKDEQLHSATHSAPSPGCDSPAQNSHLAAQMQTSMAPNTRTRSRGPPKINNTAHGGIFSTPSTPSTRGSTRGGRGRGGATLGKRAKGVKGSDPDAEFDPAHSAGI